MRSNTLIVYLALALTLSMPSFAHAQLVDFRLVDAKVTTNGRLQVYTAVTRSASPRMVKVSDYSVAFMVSKGTGVFQRYEKTIPAAGGWIDLGHIDAHTTPTDRVNNHILPFTILINQPATIIESNYNNNRIEKTLRIRNQYVTCVLHPRPPFNSRANTLDYTVDQFKQVVTSADLGFMNLGYGEVRGSIRVRQLITSMPGELGTRHGDVSLGMKPIHLRAFDERVENSSYTVVPLFGGGILFPHKGDGELIIRLYEGLATYQPTLPPEIRIPFKYKKSK